MSEVPLKVLVAIKALALSISYLCNEIFHISRPTFYRNAERFENGEEYKIPTDLKQFFHFITEGEVSRKDVDEFLRRIRVKNYETERLSSDYDVKRGIGLLDTDDNCYLTGTLKSKQKTDDKDLLTFEETITILKQKIIDFMEDMIPRYYGSDTKLPDNVTVLYSSEIYKDYYLSYFYTKIVDALLSDPIIKESPIKAVNKLFTDSKYAVECIHYVLANVKDIDDPSQYKALVNELNRSTFDVMSPKEWYVIGGLYTVTPNDDRRDTVGFEAKIFEATSHNDALAAGFAILRKARFKVFLTRVFGPFMDKNSAMRVADYLELDWMNTAPIASANQSVAESWLDDQTEKTALKGGATDSPYSQ